MGVIDNHVLVLNRSWVPVAVTTVQSAVVKVFSGGAKFLDENYQLHTADEWMKLPVLEGKPALHSPSCQMKTPEVIMLLKYDEVPKRSLTFSRYKVFKRDRYTCQYCGDQPGVKDLTIDHVVPRAAGGTTNWENCVTACEECNRKKADAHPIPKGMKLKTVPHKPRWRLALVVGVKRHPESWVPFLPKELAASSS